MEQKISLEGSWQVKLEDERIYDCAIPGTLDTSGIGGADQEGLTGRFTRKHTYEGKAVFSTCFVLPEQACGKRVFFRTERARCLELFLNGVKQEEYVPGTLSTPWIFELTCLQEGENRLEIISDNSYPGLPRENIVYSSAATDETQTNWNGMPGETCLLLEPQVLVADVRVYPCGGTLTVAVAVDAGSDYDGSLTLTSGALAEDVERSIHLKKGERRSWVFEGLSLAADVVPWEERDEASSAAEASLYAMEAALKGAGRRRVSFGVRTFCVDSQARLSLNGRPVFLRSEASCCVFPETGFMPQTEEEWEKVLLTYYSYGVNCVRFHSHCPPEPAFAAADRLGILMQPELSHWNPVNALETEESFAYYKKELIRIIEVYANHPSFVMLTLGNELQAGEVGHARMDELMRLARSLDPTRLYANGSNCHYGAQGPDRESDFYTAQCVDKLSLRAVCSGDAGYGLEGYINREYPSAMRDYVPAVRRVREEYRQPVFSFEVGQYQVLPDFDELECFHGVTDPVNYRLIRDKVRAAGREEDWKRYVEASGELSLIGYREEVEAVLRTEGMSGISLLGLQDFPGQGTALVGMLDSHLQPKPYDFARPERFRRFFAPVVPLVLLPKYTYEGGEHIAFQVKLAHYGKEAFGAKGSWRLSAAAAQEDVLLEGGFPETVYEPGGLRPAGEIRLTLPDTARALRLELTVSIGKYENSYPLWLYPAGLPVFPVAGSFRKDEILITDRLDGEAAEYLKAGGKVFYQPKTTPEAMPDSIRGQFTTDFWSVGTFPHQDGGMGCLIESDHPMLDGFPTETYSNWQWWPMAGGRPVILPDQIRPVVTVMDSCLRMKHMGLLFECRAGGGRLVYSGMGLLHRQQYPEVRALLASILSYMQTERFAPEQELELDGGLFR